MNIEYIRYKNIDKTKWDTCIKNAVNGLIYARSFYLDNTAENWDALVLNDYEAVMPLIWKKKWGIKYLYQPAFVQQGGIFFCKPLPDTAVSAFVKTLTTHFNFAEITLNYANTNFNTVAGIQKTERTNYLLSLNKPYKEIFKNYHPNFTKSLRRIQKFNLHYAASNDFTGVIALYKNLYLKKLPSVKEKDITGFKNICAKLSTEGNLIIRQVYSAGDALLSVVLLLKDEGRLYNIISCITKEGKKNEANYFLYDKVLAEFCEHDLLLDMEGSDRKGIADFYKKLNPVNEPYPFIKYNNLNSFIKLFKQ